MLIKGILYHSNFKIHDKVDLYIVSKTLSFTIAINSLRLRNLKMYSKVQLIDKMYFINLNKLQQIPNEAKIFK